MKDNRPIYANPINKKRQINFDEELLIIFFSILEYIGEAYGFTKEIDCHFQLIKGKRFETYLRGFGTTRLLQIKYKYFSDKALELWRLCFAFFNESRQIFISTEQKEYLLVKNFYIVFEAIIDELIGDKPLPDGMDKKQEDGKIVDHLFTASSLVEGEAKQTYYIGDSKYYKIGHNLTEESIYKQYTYARNVIQWNLNIFNKKETTESGVRLRDDFTEGYNIIPNFFVSAKMNDNFDYSDDGIEKTDRTKNRHTQIQFKNRLFDRDTLLLFHYDVNFLFVLSLYARNNASQKAQWKRQIREKFRREIQDWLQEYYDFYAMRAHPGVSAGNYLEKHFREVLGKIYAPYENENIFSLALDKDKKFEEKNETLIKELRHSFYIEPCRLGENLQTVLEKYAGETTRLPETADGKDGVLMVMMENYDKKSRNFLSNGKLAIGIKYTMESMDIVKHLDSIGYVLFHHRSDEGRHLFMVKSPCELKPKDEIEQGRYKTMETTRMYVTVDIDTSMEIVNHNLMPAKKSYTPETRYDAQYATLQELRCS
ncbi:MAG: LlaJI family restriction endonuclease [Porphyromonadaceae bacterium]|nr:LlaJI family restriction endonuclease [Porphyromonadaceae bacterium]